ncbi:MAG: hypothetical protein R2722_10435 [Tessaracoccus sp.]
MAASRARGGDPGSFYREYANSTCTTYAGDAGLQFPGAAQDASNGAPFEEMSVERLGELSEFDAVLYPLGPDGKPTPAMVPLLESNAWKSLPLVQSDKALPVVCPYGTMTYTSGILNLKSLDEALGLAITAG